MKNLYVILYLVNLLLLSTLTDIVIIYSNNQILYLKYNNISIN